MNNWREKGISRNAPCPCGSGKRYKHCHGSLAGEPIPAQLTPRLTPVTDLELRKLIEAHQRRQEEVKARFGAVTFPNAPIFQNYRVTGVGNKLHWMDPKATVAQFMSELLIDCLSKEWFAAQLSKSNLERHPVCQWWQELKNLTDAIEPKGEVIEVKKTGPAAAWLNLAYDIWTLQHHIGLAEELVRRLKLPGEYQSTRHEISTAALFVRAGFDLEMVDQTDKSQRNVEFWARPKTGGPAIAVEAKSRYRPGILGFPGQVESETELSAGIKRQLNQALKKEPECPFVICIDLNLPPFSGALLDSPLVQETFRAVERRLRRYADRVPVNLIIFVNHPHHYGASNAPDPRRDSYLMIVPNPAHPFIDTKTPESLTRALSQYGAFPNTWDDLNY